MFNSAGFFSRFVLLSVICVSCLNLTACFVLPEEAQRELERQVQEEIKKAIQEAIDNAIEGVKEESKRLLETAKEKAKDAWNDFTESAGNTADKGKEYAGFAAPEQCGFVDSAISTLTAKMDIAQAFHDLYKDSGGGRVIGWPDDNVQVYSDSSGKWLYQYFVGGSETRSMMIMKDGESTVYLVPGEWLRTYENLGGLKDAGKPVSSIQNFDNWLLWGKDQIQRYAWDGEVYVLMKPGDVEQVMVVPPLFWNYYLDHDGISELGAALSSYPLDEEKAIDELSSNSRFSDLIEVWKVQPFRIQVFEKGSLLYNTETDSFSLVKVQNLWLGEDRLAIDIGDLLLKDEYDNGSYTDACYHNTIVSAGTLAQTKGTSKLIKKVPLIIVDSAATVGSWTAEGWGARLFYELTKLVVARVNDEDVIYAAGESIASNALDSLYGKIIGDTLSSPLADASVESAKGAFENLQKDRLSIVLSGTNSNIKMSLNYDPFTHYAWGIITSDCQPEGYLYIVQLKPQDFNGWFVEGTERYYDLANDGIEIKP